MNPAEWEDLNYNDVMQAVRRGDNRAKTVLAWLKLSGLGGAEKDPEGAIELLEERIKDGDADAMWMLGVCAKYINGDEKRAEALFGRSSNGGDEIGTVLASHRRGKLKIDYEKLHLLRRILPITPITSLDLSYGNIGNEGATNLSGILMTNTTVTELNLFYNEIRDEGATSLSVLLQQNDSLTELNLGSNPIGEDGATAISDSLNVNSTLTSLDLSDCHIEGEALSAICEALKTNDNVTLFRLNLSGNSIKDGVEYISSFLEQNTSLTRLDLSNNRIGNEEVEVLSESLERNSSLKKLILDRNKIDDDGASVILESLRTNTTLIELFLDSNPIS